MKSIFRNSGKIILEYSTNGTFAWRAKTGEVALTFDDGPDPVYTPVILNELSRLGIRATFFLIGEKVIAHPALANEIKRQGHGLGGHSFTHRELTTMNPSELKSDLIATRAAIKEVTGVDTSVFRPPRGKFDLSTLRTAAREQFKLIHWSVTYSDYRRDGAAPLIERIGRRPPRDRDVILLHDNNEYTAQALPMLVGAAGHAGLKFVSLM